VTVDEAKALLDGLTEKLAAIEHERWSHWQRYMHGKAEKQPDGTLLIPADLVQRWEQQLETPYDNLSEREKESDRDQVRKYLPVIADALSRSPK
jgi:hypothetical protein